jgi:hypothetical protein
MVGLYTTIALLMALSIAGQFAKHVLGFPTLLGLVRLFYVELEANAPSWYQATAFAFGALLLATIGTMVRRSGAPFWRHWMVLAAIFLFLSLDESAGIHELTMEPLQRVNGIVHGAFRAQWVMIGLAAVAVVAAAYARFFFHLSGRERAHVLVAGILFVGGAIGIEMATQAMYGEDYDPSLKEGLAYVIGAHIEEGLEMVGLAVFIDFLLARLTRIAAPTDS